MLDLEVHTWSPTRRVSLFEPVFELTDASSEMFGILAFDGLLPPSFLFSSRTLTSSKSDMNREDKPIFPSSHFVLQIAIFRGKYLDEFQ